MRRRGPRTILFHKRQAKGIEQLLKQLLFIRSKVSGGFLFQNAQQIDQMAGLFQIVRQLIGRSAGTRRFPCGGPDAQRGERGGPEAQDQFGQRGGLGRRMPIFVIMIRLNARG